MNKTLNVTPIIIDINNSNGLNKNNTTINPGNNMTIIENKTVIQVVIILNLYCKIIFENLFLILIF